MGTVIFYILAAICVVCGVLVVTRKNAVTSAVFLVVLMAALSGLFVQLGSIFVAVLQIIVYAGAIMVLFLFVIMMLNLNKDEFGFDSRIFQRVLAVVLSVIFVLQFVLIASKFPATATMPIDQTVGDIRSIAFKLFYDNIYAFEIVGMLLLAAIIGAVVIARREGD